MTYETDGARGLPTNVLSCGAGKTEQLLIDRARNGDKRAERRLWRIAEDELRIVASKRFGVAKKCDKRVDDAVSTQVEQFIDALSVGWELFVECIHGSGSRRYTGVTASGAPLTFQQHLRRMFRWKLNDCWQEDKHDEISPRSRRRFESIVEEAHPEGVFDESAIPLARERVKAGKYAGEISLEMFDRCWEEQSPLSLEMETRVQRESGRAGTLADTLASTVFDLPLTSEEGRIAQETFDKLGPRQQEQFARATGLWGEKESNVEIAASLGITPQGVGYNVMSVRRFIESAIEDYRFNAGLPRFKP